MSRLRGFRETLEHKILTLDRKEEMGVADVDVDVGVDSDQEVHNRLLC